MIKWIWHEQANVMALADLTGSGLPLISICDDIPMINPFYSYTYDWLLEYYGWIEIGDL